MASRDGSKPPGRTLADHLDSLHRVGSFERRKLIDASVLMLDGCYVHLRQKRAHYAIDPVAVLRKLRPDAETLTQQQFDDSVLSVYSSLRDLHTGARLSGRAAKATAVLPILVERYGPPARGRYLVTKLAAWAPDGPLVEGSTPLYWNGVPLELAVARHAQRSRGANADARLARAMDTLTVRHLGDGFAPDEHWVDLQFRTPDGAIEETRLTWRVLLLDVPEGRTATHEVFDLEVMSAPRRDRQLELAFNPTGQSAQQAKRALYAKDRDTDVATTLPTVFRATPRSFGSGTFGHVRIWSFMHDDPSELVEEFVRLADHFEHEGCRGLIVDIRGNPGGYVASAEALLRCLAHRALEPTRFAFAPTRLTEQLCANDPSLGGWLASIRSATDTGEPYSQALPITDDDGTPACTTSLPAVLVIDALAYSAADIFAAGWVDHDIGPVVGTATTTGAGGANVWTYEQITARLDQDTDSLAPSLQGGTSLRFAVRRAVRSGAFAGQPIEDIGVTVPPEHVHDLTRTDVLDGNRDLLRFAVSKLKEGPTP